MGHGDEVAYHFEGDRWDSSLHDGRGGPVVSYAITRKQLLLETVKAAQVLQHLGLRRGDRLALNLPNIMEQIYYTEAAKRLGIIYTAVFGGFSDKTLSDRIHNAGARVVVTSDGAYRNAQIVPFKETYTDPALDRFLPVESAMAIVVETLERIDFGGTAAATISQIKDAILREVELTLAGDITVERSDVMRGVGQAISQRVEMDAVLQSRIRTAIAQALVASPSRVDAVVVVRHTGQEILWRSERDVWSHELIAQATATILANARAAGIEVASEQALLALPTAQFVQALYATSRAEPVSAETPMFIIYTSGSTGKPKGVVHVHGGYLAGLVHTMRVSFDAQPGDVIYVIADPGWITGQSYLISATLAAALHGCGGRGLPRVSLGRAFRIDDRALRSADLQGRRHVSQDGDGRPAERRRRQGLRPAHLAGGHILRRTGEPVRATVRHGIDDTAVHQLLLGHRTRRHRLDALFRQLRLSAVRRMRTPIRCPGSWVTCGFRLAVRAVP